MKCHAVYLPQFAAYSFICLKQMISGNKFVLLADGVFLLLDKDHSMSGVPFCEHETLLQPTADAFVILGNCL